MMIRILFFVSLWLNLLIFVYAIINDRTFNAVVSMMALGPAFKVLWETGGDF